MSDSVWIKVPALIIAVNPINKQPLMTTDGGSLRNDDPWSLVRFLSTFIIADKRFGNSVSGLRQVMKLMDALEGKNPGEWCKIDKETWQKLKTVMDEREGSSYPPQVVYQLLPIIDSILDASLEDPQKK